MQIDPAQTPKLSETSHEDALQTEDQITSNENIALRVAQEVLERSNPLPASSSTATVAMPISSPIVTPNSSTLETILKKEGFWTRTREIARHFTDVPPPPFLVSLDRKPGFLTVWTNTGDNSKYLDTNLLSARASLDQLRRVVINAHRCSTASEFEAKMKRGMRGDVFFYRNKAPGQYTLGEINAQGLRLRQLMERRPFVL